MLQILVKNVQIDPELIVKLIAATLHRLSTLFVS